MDADPHLKLADASVRERKLGSAELRHHFERSAHRAFRIVAARGRIAEIDEDPVSGEVADKAAKPFGDVEGDLTVAALDGEQVFGVDLLG